MTYETVVRGGTLVLPEGPVEADLAIAEGRIVALGRGLTGEHAIDARGLLVLPGLIDPHVHPIHAETYHSVSRAGLRGGVTTLGHHLYTPPDGDPVAAFEQARLEAEASSHADFVFHVRLNDLTRTAAAIAKLVERGSTSFKLFLAYGSRGVQVRDDELLLAMQAAERAGALLLFHAENGHVADLLEAQARARGEDRLAAYYRARPRWVEAEAVERITRLLRIAPARSYLVHLTCRESLAAVRVAKDAALPVVGEFERGRERLWEVDFDAGDVFEPVRVGNFGDELQRAGLLKLRRRIDRVDHRRAEADARKLEQSADLVAQQTVVVHGVDEYGVAPALPAPERERHRRGVAPVLPRL